jgi:hypothetical protein
MGVAIAASAISNEDFEAKAFSPKMLSPLIFVGEIQQVVANYGELRAPKNVPLKNIFGITHGITAQVRVLKTLKNSIDVKLVDPIYFDIYNRFDVPHTENVSLADLESILVGRRFVFFGHELQSVGEKAYYVTSRLRELPEPIEQEQEILQLIKLAQSAEAECRRRKATWDDGTNSRPVCVDDTEQQCLSRGGRWYREGLMRVLQCVVPTRDGGKNCSDGTQCEHECVYTGRTLHEASEPITGQCSHERNHFGCRTLVAKGKIGFTICVD